MAALGTEPGVLPLSLSVLTPPMLKLFTLALVCLLAAPLGACGDSADPGQIEVRRLRLVRQANGYPEVSGTLVNRTPEHIRSADVGVRLFNSDNLPFNEPVRLVVRDIAPGDSVRFRQKLDVDARGARLDYVLAN